MSLEQMMRTVMEENAYLPQPDLKLSVCELGDTATCGACTRHHALKPIAASTTAATSTAQRPRAPDAAMTRASRLAGGALSSSRARSAVSA